MTFQNILFGDLPSLKEWSTIECDQLCQKIEIEPINLNFRILVGVTSTRSNESKLQGTSRQKQSTQSVIHKTRPWDKIITKVTNTQIYVFGTNVLCFEGWDWSSQDFEIETLKAISVGYEINTRAYRVYVIDLHKVAKSVNVTFHDTKIFGT